MLHVTDALDWCRGINPAKWAGGGCGQMWRRLLRAAATGRRGPGAAARALSTAIEEKTPEQFLALNGSQHATSLLLSRSAVVYSPAPSYTRAFPARGRRVLICRAVV